MLCLQSIIICSEVGDEAILNVNELWDRYEKAVDKICFQTFTSFETFSSTTKLSSPFLSLDFFGVICKISLSFILQAFLYLNESFEKGIWIPDHKERDFFMSYWKNN